MSSDNQQAGKPVDYRTICMFVNHANGHSNDCLRMFNTKP